MLTIDELEAIATQCTAEADAERERLARLIKIYARIIAARVPGKFRRGPLERSGDDGHYYSSFPPVILYKDFRGPRLIRIVEHEVSDISTSGGFYHEFRRVTEDPGLYISPEGAPYGADETGTGRVGQFAARPGYCEVMCAIEYRELAPDDVPLDRLQEAERKLRALAFPLVAAREKSAASA